MKYFHRFMFPANEQCNSKNIIRNTHQISILFAFFCYRALMAVVLVLLHGSYSERLNARASRTVIPQVFNHSLILSLRTDVRPMRTCFDEHHLLCIVFHLLLRPHPGQLGQKQIGSISFENLLVKTSQQASL